MDHAVLFLAISVLIYFRLYTKFLFWCISAPPVLSQKPKTRRIAFGVIITWTAPKNSLANDTILYNVQCFLCIVQNKCDTSCYNQTISNTTCYNQTISNATCNITQTTCNTSCINEIYHPRAKKLNQTRVTVSNLTVGKKYIFRVYPTNSLNVSEGEWRYNETNPVEVSSGKEMNDVEGCQRLYKQKSHTTCTKFANKLPTNCVPAKCCKLSASFEQAVRNL